MAMTIVEKIMAKHAGLRSITANELVYARVDLVMGTDIASPLAIDVFDRMGGNKVFDKKPFLCMMFRSIFLFNLFN